MLDNAIIVLIITTSSNLIFGLAKLIAKSKCSEVSCCGCIIKRDVILEEKENEFEITHPQNRNLIE
jgi:hypothetical protein